MKNLLSITLCLMISTISFAQNSDIFMEKFAEMQKAFDTRNIDAFSSHFTDQVNFVGPTGMVGTSKQIVHDSHVQVFKMLGPQSAGVEDNVKMIQSYSLGKDYHLLSVENKQTLGEESSHYVFTFIFVRTGSDWKVTSAQLTPVLKQS